MTDPVALSLGRGATLNRPRDWASFECLARDLYARLLGDRDTDLHGRTGQPQAGVDVYGVDQRTGERVGVQCKGRNDAAFIGGKSLTVQELRDEVEKARGFQPPIARFVLLTTGPNDIALQAAARELDLEHRANGSFCVSFHGWDWIEAQLATHIDLVVLYDLAAVARPVSAPDSGSAIALEIGGRLQHAISLMNNDLDADECFTVQGLARHMGHSDWRRLEQIVAGTADADVDELTELAEALGLSLLWLLEGKGAPFLNDADFHRRRVEDLHDDIMALAPERIVLVRQREGGDDHHDALIVAQHDLVRWTVFRSTYPACGRVGGGGARDLYDLCRLLRRFDNVDCDARVLVTGKHLDSPDLEALREGEIYPGTKLRFLTNDQWWQDLAALRPDWVHGDAPHAEALREAIHIVRHQIDRARQSARAHEHWAQSLAWGYLERTAPKPENGNPEPYR